MHAPHPEPRAAQAREGGTVKKTIILATLLLALAGLAVAQEAPLPCTITIASGQSLSPAFATGPASTINGTGCTALTSMVAGAPVIGTPLEIIPMDAAGNLTTLDATSAALQPYTCIDTAGAHCTPLADKDGNAITFKFVGGASPTSAIQLDPTVMAGGRTFKFQVVTSAGAAVAQTANRTFTLMVRPL
jgi:hypothetical protein